MKTFILIFSFLVSNSVFANCKVYIPNKHFSVQENHLYLDFSQMLSEHNYVETKNAVEADFRIDIKGRDKIALPFIYAEAIITWSQANGLPIVSLITTKQCYSGACTLQNYHNSFRRALAALSSNLRDCY